MHNNAMNKTSVETTIHFQIDNSERQRLKRLPWRFPLEEWPQHGVVPLVIRRGECPTSVIGRTWADGYL